MPADSEAVQSIAHSFPRFVCMCHEDVNFGSCPTKRLEPEQTKHSSYQDLKNAWAGRRQNKEITAGSSQRARVRSSGG